MSSPTNEEIIKIGPYRGCYPQLLQVPVFLVLHKSGEGEIKRKNRKRKAEEVSAKTTGEICKYFVKPDEYYVLPYDNCRIVSKSRSHCGRGKSERIKLRVSDGTYKKFMKSHVILSTCLPLITPDTTVEHLDGHPKNIDSNRLENIIWMSQADNSRRANLLCGTTRRQRTTISASRQIKRISVKNPDEVELFPSSQEAARKTPGTFPSGISASANGERQTHPRGQYRWEWVPQEFRTPPAGKVREVIYLKNLPEVVKSLANSLVQGKSNKGYILKPPKAVSNLGEVLTNKNRWIIGSRQTRVHAKSRCYQNVNIATWVYLFFHGLFDPDTQQINHKDGDQNNPRRYSPDTYLPDGTYSNFEWAIYAGSHQQNMQDLSAAKKRKRRA